MESTPLDVYHLPFGPLPAFELDNLCDRLPGLGAQSGWVSSDESHRLNPSYADTYYNLARLLARNGRQEEAIACYRKALAIDPDDADAHNNLGLLLAVRGNTVESLVEFRKAVQIDPKDARAYFNMGRIFAAQGRT